MSMAHTKLFSFSVASKQNAIENVNLVYVIPTISSHHIPVSFVCILSINMTMLNEFTSFTESGCVQNISCMTFDKSSNLHQCTYISHSSNIINCCIFILYLVVIFDEHSLHYNLALSLSHSSHFSLSWLVKYFLALLKSLSYPQPYPFHQHLTFQRTNDSSHDCEIHKLISPSTLHHKLIYVFFILSVFASSLTT